MRWVRLGIGILAAGGCTEEPAHRQHPAGAVSTPQAVSPSAPAIWISEAMAANASVYQTPDGAFPDWFELHNASIEPVDVGRLVVADSGGEAWRGPATTVLPPGGQLLVLADDVHAPGHAPFKLSSEYEHLSLYVDGVLVDTLAIASLPTDVALARSPDGQALFPTIWATPGAPNGTRASETLDPADTLFGERVLPVSIEVEPWYEGELDRKDGEGVPARVTLDGVTLSVTVKLKGSGSYAPLTEKAAFSIDINQVVDGQRFRGLEKIILNNGAHDPTYVRESLAYELFAAAGIPAPRLGWARVTYNGEDYGLYVHVEAIDDRFLDRWYDLPDGMLLEGAIGADFGVDFALLALDEGEWDYDYLNALSQVLAPPTHPNELAELEAMVDVDQFVRYAAVEAVAMHWDGYQKPKNFYAYLNPRTDKLEWLPSGTDWTWMQEYPVDYGQGEVFRFCWDQAPCRDRYLQQVLEIADLADSLDLHGRYADRLAWIDPEVAGDPRDAHGKKRRQRHRDMTAEHLLTRTDKLRDQVASHLE